MQSIYSQDVEAEHTENDREWHTRVSSQKWELHIFDIAVGVGAASTARPLYIDKKKNRMKYVSLHFD